MKPKVQFIKGQWLTGEGTLFESTNPADNTVLWSGHNASTAQVDLAVQAAREGFYVWSQLSLSERLQFVKSYGELVAKNKEELAKLISDENGKPHWEALTEASAMAGKINLSINSYQERNNPTFKEMPGGKVSVTRYKPHGVVAVFGPYNFPGHLANGHIVPALIAGNTIVFKPSELTPKVAEFMVQLWEQTKLPKGVINLVQGAKDTGVALAKHSGIDGLFFTGSSQTGQIIHENLAKKPQTILALEMGGNNPLVVHDVKDIKAASFLTIQSAFLTAGQRCTCSRRLIVPLGEAGDLFIKQLTEDIQKITVGVASDRPEPFMGPVITKQAALHILEEQNQLIARGGASLVKSRHINEDTGLISPGLIDVTLVSELSDQEIFGPLLQLIRVDGFDTAITEANNTAYGLSAGLLCDDKQAYLKFFNKIRAGIVNWNNQLTGASGAAPFGGIGLSGNHKPSAYFAADYCSYPVASIESETIDLPQNMPQGLENLTP